MNRNLSMLVLASIALAACSTTPKVATVESAPQPTSAGNPSIAAPAESTAMRPTDVSSDNLATQLQEMKQNSVYFDFDRFSIKPGFREVIQRQGDFLKAHPNIFLTLEGNADERGSGEYNLALGDKRANSVRKALEFIGVSNNRINAVSYGEERPRLNCHEEKCWMENRRVDFTGKQD